MSLTKSETDDIILTEVQQRNDNEINTTYYRNTSSIHPKDCSCDVCKPLEFTDTGSKAEADLKTKLNWYQGD